MSLSHAPPAADHARHATLPTIPVLETARDFPIQTLIHQRARANALMDLATRRYPVRALAADRKSVV